MKQHERILDGRACRNGMRLMRGSGNRPRGRRRAQAALWLAVALAGWWPAWRVEAATVTGLVRDRRGDPAPLTNVVFRPLERPLFRPGEVLPGWSVVTNTTATGTFVAVLGAGHYQFSVGSDPRDGAVICVPDDTNTYDLAVLVTNAAALRWSFPPTNWLMRGATVNAAGAAGLAPAPAAGQHTNFLRGDGTWAAVNSGGSGPTNFVATLAGSATNLAVWASDLDVLPLRVYGAPYQAEDLTAWREAGGTTLAGVDAAGTFWGAGLRLGSAGGPGFTPSGGTNVEFGGGNLLWAADGVGNLGSISGSRPNYIYAKTTVRGDAQVQAGDFATITSGGGYTVASRGGWTCYSGDGIVQWKNNAANGFGRFQFGNITTNYAALINESGGGTNLLGLGDATGAGGASGCGLVLHQMHFEPLHPVANAARVYALDSGGTAELFVQDEAGNRTQLSPHAITSFPTNLAGTNLAAYPLVLHHRNEYLGVEAWIDVATLAKTLQAVARAQGVLKSNEFIYVERTFPRRSWGEDQAQLEAAWNAERSRELAVLAEALALHAAGVAGVGTNLAVRPPYLKKPVPPWMAARGAR